MFAQLASMILRGMREIEDSAKEHQPVQLPVQESPLRGREKQDEPPRQSVQEKTE